MTSTPSPMPYATPERDAPRIVLGVAGGIAAYKAVEVLRRLRGRGDGDEHVQRRLASTPSELARGRALADYVIINDDLERATRQILSILEGLRRSPRTPSTKETTHG